jgi:hypothetical protein
MRTVRPPSCRVRGRSPEPCALNGVHLVAPGREDEVDFAAGLVTPVAYGLVEGRLQVVESHVFPQQPAVVVSERILAACVGHEARVERIHLGHLDDLGLATAVERVMTHMR